MGEELICPGVAVPYICCAPQDIGALPVPPDIHKPRRTFNMLCAARYHNPDLGCVHYRCQLPVYPIRISMG